MHWGQGFIIFYSNFIRKSEQRKVSPCESVFLNVLNIFKRHYGDHCTLDCFHTYLPFYMLIDAI